LKALLHNDCTGKVPVDNMMSAAAPWPELIQAHLSPFSAPPESVPSARELVGYRFSHFMTPDDRDACIGARPLKWWPSAA